MKQFLPKILVAAACVAATGSAAAGGRFPRTLVVEDFTGLRCGYCPIGYVAMDKLKEEYKDKDEKFIGIAVHNYSSDLMHCDSYNDYVTHYVFASAPDAFINREVRSFPSYNTLLSHWGEIDHTSEAEVKLTPFFTDDTRQEVEVKATCRFDRQLMVSDYGLAFVLTEDNVGPYRQDNYYNEDPSVPELYGKGDHPMMMFNEVAREIIGWDGIEGSIPSRIVMDEEYDYSRTISLSKCFNVDGSHLTALLLNRDTGVIVNAAQVHLKEVEINDGIGIINADLKAEGLKGCIRFGNLDGMVSVFDISGKLIKRINESGELSLHPGIYIVTANGKTKKIIVK